MLCLVLALTLAACGQASNSSLYFVWPGPHCPPPTALTPDKAAGFTSRAVAVKVARIEEAGPRVYWRKRIVYYGAHLLAAEHAARLNPSRQTIAIQALRVKLAGARAGLESYQACTRIVKKGKPNHQAVGERASKAPPAQ